MLMSCLETDGTGILDLVGCVGGILHGIYLFISLYIVYLTTLSLRQTILDRVVGWLVNNELKRMLK
jgi:hypothetical protein